MKTWHALCLVLKPVAGMAAGVHLLAHLIADGQAVVISADVLEGFDLRQRDHDHFADAESAAMVPLVDVVLFTSEALVQGQRVAVLAVLLAGGTSDKSG